MLDQEEHDLNGYFWEEWQCPPGAAGESLYYFPLAGEFRLTKVLAWRRPAWSHAAATRPGAPTLTSPFRPLL